MLRMVALDSAIAVTEAMRRRYEGTANARALGVALLHLSAAEADVRPDSALQHAARALPLLEAANDTVYRHGTAGHLVRLRLQRAQRALTRGDTAAAIASLAAAAPSHCVR